VFGPLAAPLMSAARRALALRRTLLTTARPLHDVATPHGLRSVVTQGSALWAVTLSPLTGSSLLPRATTLLSASDAALATTQVSARVSSAVVWSASGALVDSKTESAVASGRDRN
jgi:hypothetical protein